MGSWRHSGDRDQDSCISTTVRLCFKRGYNHVFYWIPTLNPDICVPSEAGTSKLDNPARSKPNQQAGTEFCTY